MAPNGPKNAELTAKQEAVAVALAPGKSNREAAEECHVGERTVKRWRAELPQLQQRVTELRAEMAGATVGRMTAGLSAAADTLHELLAAPQATVRLGAARSLLELTVKLRESTELEARIAALEQQQKERSR